jgi:carbamate kinase
MPNTVVVALGGNAFTRAGQSGTYEEQTRNALTMARSVLSIRRSGWNVVIVHGNGPQVGNLAIQQEEGRRLVPAQPLFSLGAMTQGEIGSLLSLALRAEDADVAVAALISHVVVALEDPAFRAPSKPIGPFFTRARADELAADRGWTVGEDSGRGFRRLVASPRPVEIVETATIRRLVAGGTIVIAGGGGGVPVAPGGAGLVGIDAVIDKDYVAGHLATALRAEALVFVTDVPRLMLNFGLPTERALDEIDVTAAERHQRDRQFAAGSMGPKVHAATEFLRSGGDVAVITTAEFVARTLQPTADITADGSGHGTRIVAELRAARMAS